jgi:hypothetical protein
MMGPPRTAPPIAEPTRLIDATKRMGIDDSPQGRRARRDALVDSLLATTEETAARRREVTRAEDAATAWVVTTTGHAPAGPLARRLHETAVTMRADPDDDRNPAITLIRLVVEAIERHHHP